MIRNSPTKNATKRMPKAGTVHPDFSMVTRNIGIVWLHKSKPVWVVMYDGVPGSNTNRFDSWQAYRAVQKVPQGRQPWTVDNKRIGPDDGYPTEAEAFKAAAEFANSL